MPMSEQLECKHFPNASVKVEFPVLQLPWALCRGFCIAIKCFGQQLLWWELHFGKRGPTGGWSQGKLRAAPAASPGSELRIAAQLSTLQALFRF